VSKFISLFGKKVGFSKVVLTSVLAIAMLFWMFYLLVRAGL